MPLPVYWLLWGGARAIAYCLFLTVTAAALLERIRPDGVLDPSYPPQHVYGAGKLITGGLLAASDGTAGGYFATGDRPAPQPTTRQEPTTGEARIHV